MANDKRFIVKNGLQTQNIKFVSADETKNISTIIDNDGTISFTGSNGNMLSLSNTGNATVVGSVYGNNFYVGSWGQVIDSQGNWTGNTIKTNWITKNSNYTAEINESIIADTSTETFTITLPANPTLGDSLSIIDGGNFSVNNLLVSGNGSTIENSYDTLIINVDGVRVDFVYDGVDWQVFSNVGPIGFTGSQGYTGSKGDIGFTGSAGISGAFEWVVKNSNYTASPGDAVLADTSAGTFTVTLPANPVPGYAVAVADASDWEINNLTVAASGTDTIETTLTSIDLDIKNIKIEFIYDGSTWQIYSNIGKLGFTGSQGIQGFTGSQGNLGYTGSIGFTGSQGIQGIQGFTGSQGNLGYTGSQGVGFTGSQGIQGFTGSQGNLGYTGSQGVGFTGSQGIQGFTGSQGIQGFTGSQGDLGYTGSIGFTGSHGLFNWILATSNYSAEIGDSILADTTAGAISITLPASPTLGATVVVVDAGNNSTNSITVLRNGSLIEGLADDLIIDVIDVRVDLVYNGSSWQIFTNVGPEGVPGYTGSAGTNGFTGSHGFTGSRGNTGFTGSAGPIAGTDGQFVYNNGGDAAGTTNVYYDDVNNRVGILTTSPVATLDVAGTGAMKVPVGTDAQRPNPTAGMIRFSSTSNSFEGYTGTVWGEIGGSVSLTNDTSTSANTYYLTMADNQSSGKVSDLTVSSTKLYFNPFSGALSATEFNSLSDVAYKTDIKEIENPESIINQIDGKYFKWKDNDRYSYGVIAQELEQILPELVSISDDGKRSVAYTPLISILIENVKKLNKEIEQLKGAN